MNPATGTSAPGREGAGGGRQAGRREELMRSVGCWRSPAGPTEGPAASLTGAGEACSLGRWAGRCDSRAPRRPVAAVGSVTSTSTTSVGRFDRYRVHRRRRSGPSSRVDQRRGCIRGCGRSPRRRSSPRPLSTHSGSASAFKRGALPSASRRRHRQRTCATVRVRTGLAATGRRRWRGSSAEALEACRSRGLARLGVGAAETEVRQL